jgi:hypothetical protein
MSKDEGVVVEGDKAPPPKKKGYVTFRKGTIVSVVLLVLLAGNCHVVYGGGSSGVNVCEKDGWYLSETFVDLDDYIGKPLIQNLDKARILRALFACELLERPQFGDRE